MSLTATTLAKAATAGDTALKVTATTGFVVGNIAKVDSEFYLVTGVDTTTYLISVIPGQNGTLAVAHPNGARIVTGTPAEFSVIPKPRTYTYTTAGAVTMAPGAHLFKTGTAGAMTLADPTADLEGIELELIALDAQAYTLTYTAGFAANTTSGDVATWGGAIGDAMTIKVVNGIWNIVSLRNVTIG